MTTQNTHDYASHFPRRANVSVRNMVYSADVDRNGFARMELGQPPALSAAGIVSLSSIAAAVVRSSVGIVANHRASMGRYGRGITVVLSGAGTPAMEVFGMDYLGQPMSETFTGAGTTPVVGKKAFKEVTGWSSGLVAATTVSIGWSNILGLPYAIGAFTDEYLDGVTPANAGTKVIAILVTQTAATGDPRGTYTPVTVLPDGIRDWVIVGKVIEGDLHGLPHFITP